MHEMLKERKAALEAQGKKGFTLMEMLIVIAIIAILIAIAIPIFTAQMDRAKVATAAANARSAYASVTAEGMTQNPPVPATSASLNAALGTIDSQGASVSVIGSEVSVWLGNQSMKFSVSYSS